jgi:hypothetical protein
LIQHPCRNQETWVYVCSDKYLQVPVLYGNRNKFALDDFVAEQTRPFYSQGKGMLLCPICDQRGHAAGFLRAVHFHPTNREVHWDHSFVTGLFSPTQHDSRVYQAHLVYTLCLGQLALFNPQEDDPDDEALLSMKGVDRSTLLRLVLVAPPIPTESQDSEETCEMAAIAAEIMKGAKKTEG